MCQGGNELSVSGLSGAQSLGPWPLGHWRSHGALIKFCLRAQWTPKIGELAMYFNGGTLQDLLWALGNSHGEGPRPSTKMSTGSIVYNRQMSTESIVYNRQMSTESIVYNRHNMCITWVVLLTSSWWYNRPEKSSLMIVHVWMCREPVKPAVDFT